MSNSTPSPAEQPATASDGRRARRERGRLAVISAMIDLVFEGHAPPTADQIAERAGVSIASVFRYFETLDDLRQVATAHYFDRFSDAFEIPGVGVGDLDQRVASFVAARVGQYETTAPMARLVRWRAFEISQIEASLHRLRATQADQIELHFQQELTAVARAERDAIVATIATLTSFESWDQLRVDHGRSAAQTRRAWAAALTRILCPT